jgi:3-deoxy-manno-octulosonate cytidylyltransferase (CMP-KDO synthetase)
MSFHVVIPARMASTRLPGKVLRELAGATLLEHVYRRACESDALDVTIATDNAEVEAVARGFGAAVCMTATTHESGTDRIHEVVTKLGWGEQEIVVNLQGDEPGMPPALVQQVASNLAQNSWADIATLCFAIDSWQDWQDPGLVKVVSDEQGQALYFSRAPIPFDRQANMQAKQRLPSAGARGHIGLYAYRVSALQRFSELPIAALEVSEALEQLRGMAYGLRIHVAEAQQRPGVGVDTEADLQRAEAELLAQRS